MYIYVHMGVSRLFPISAEAPWYKACLSGFLHQVNPNAWGKYLKEVD